MSLWKKFREEKRNSSENSLESTKEEKPLVDATWEVFLRELSQLNLTNYTLLGSISDILYYENAFSDISESCLLRLIKYEGEHSNAWKQLKTRRLQCWGGMPDDDGTVRNNDALPSWLNDICKSFVENGFFPADFPPNHVLINEYQPGQGIMHHTDGPKYLDRVAILSLGSGTVMSFRPRLTSEEIGTLPLDNCSMKIYLKPRSLLFFTGEAYHNYLHGIEAKSQDNIDQEENLFNSPSGESVIYRETRLSFTIRHIFREVII